ncbi:MAG: hypothetical protein CM15mP120_14800 [Pseudomonadota bacterium]|nr:MAG: hypothetical protein CM15mP120_14800 [Pseudomonadota bacterium]
METYGADALRLYSINSGLCVARSSVLPIQASETWCGALCCLGTTPIRFCEPMQK